MWKNRVEADPISTNTDEKRIHIKIWKTKNKRITN